jgi:hypothetical protein
MCSIFHMWSCFKGNIILNSTIFTEDGGSARMKYTPHAPRSTNYLTTHIHCRTPHAPRSTNYLTTHIHCRALKKPRVTRQCKKFHDSMELSHYIRTTTPHIIFAEPHHTLYSQNHTTHYIRTTTPHIPKLSQINPGHILTS